MQVKPYAGITLVNFETSDVLYVSSTLSHRARRLVNIVHGGTLTTLQLTGETTILVGPAAAALLPHAKLAVKLRVTRARQVRNGLAFRGSVLDYSPYNPPAWRLVSEQQDSRGCGKGDDPRQRPSLTLVRREVITPTIARFTFRLENPDGKTGPLPAWRAGQHVTLDFSAELDVGWSHMRDDDPASLNDDFVRTFTVSSPPPGTVKSPLSTVSEKPALAPDELQLTLRRHGPATSLLWRANVRGGLSIPVMGFAGAEEGGFRIPAPAVPSHPSSTDTTTVQQPHQQHKAVVFIAAGIGITPVLAQAPAVLAASAAIAKESQKNQICPRQPFTLLWSVRATDLPLVLDSLARVPGLAGASNIFVTGVVDAKEKETARLLDAVRDALGQQVDDSGKAKGGRLVLGRIGKDDVFGAGREFDGTDDTVRDKGKRRFMVCTGAAMLTTVREWLAGEDVVWENFGY